MFELLEKLTVDAAAGRATGQAWIPADHPFFADHFPGHPVLPGTFAVELAAQVAGPLAEEISTLHYGLERCAVLGMVRDAKFLQPVALPARLHLEAKVQRSDRARIACGVTARVDGKTALRGELLMAMVDATADWEFAVVQRKARVARWKRAPEQGPA